MKNDDPLRRARRSYIIQSVIALLVIIAFAAIITWKISQAPQLGIWQVIIPIAMWLWVGYAAWVLRKYYLRLDVNALERYGLK